MIGDDRQDFQRRAGHLALHRPFQPQMGAEIRRCPERPTGIQLHQMDATIGILFLQIREQANNIGAVGHAFGQFTNG